MTYQADIPLVREWLLRQLGSHTDEKALRWLEQQRARLETGTADTQFLMSYGIAQRFFNKNPVPLTGEAKKEASALRKGFQPEHWDLLQAARTYLLLLFPYEDQQKWITALNKLFETADMHEQQSLYAALPLLPYPTDLRKRASEGIRTNMTSVFDAIALNNPYPADFLDEAAWNQMLLKAVFMERPLFRIYGADERSNEELARMLIDFAHERWAAGRKVTPEIWRFIVFINEHNIDDIQKLAMHGSVLEKEAVLLACSRSNFPAAEKLLDRYPEIKEKTKSDEFNWEQIGQRYYS